MLPMMDGSQMHLGIVMEIQHIPHLVVVIYGFLSGWVKLDLGGHGFPIR